MSKISSWTTTKIKQVLDDAPYYRGVSGKDYSDLKDELQAELWIRQAKQASKDNSKIIRQFNKFN